MKKKRILSLLLTSLLTVSLFAGCSGNNDKNSASDGSTATKSEQVLNLVMMDPLTWDVNACYDSSSTTVLGAVYEGLVRVSSDGEKDIIEPAGAESWETSEDGLTWTFKLRKMNWNDGEPVVAKHYVDSIVRLLSPENGFAYAFFGYDVKNGKAFNEGNAKAEDLGVKAIDDYTLEITLENPVPYFLSKLSYTVFKPIRLDVIEAAGDAFASDYTTHVFNGPFVIDSYESANKIVFKKNDKYWDAENVKLETVNMTEIIEFATQAQLFESGQLDVTGATNEYVEKWTKEAEEGKWQADIGNMPQSAYLEFNQVNGGTDGLMLNGKIRKAIALSLDRQELTNELYGRYTPAYGLVAPVISVGEGLYRDEVEEPLKADAEIYNTPEKLQELFHEGLKELNKDTENLSDITINYLTYGDNELNKQRQEWLKQQIENNLGIKVDVQVEGDYKLWTAKKSENTYDILMNMWNADYDDPMTFLDMWETGGGNNDNGFSNARYDEILKELKNENDEDKRIELYKELETIVTTDEVGVAPLFYGDTRRFTHNYVKDFKTPAFGSTYEFRWAYIEGK